MQPGSARNSLSIPGWLQACGDLSKPSLQYLIASICHHTGQSQLLLIIKVLMSAILIFKKEQCNSEVCFYLKILREYKLYRIIPQHFYASVYHFNHIHMLITTSQHHKEPLHIPSLPFIFSSCPPSTKMCLLSFLFLCVSRSQI